MTKHKSYNPFKMWGAWVGFILAGGWIYIGTLQHSISQVGIGDTILTSSIYLGAGFLLGWGTHSLFRSLKK